MEPSTPNTMRQARIGAEDRERKFEVICKVRPLQESERNEDIIIDEEAPSVTIFNHPKNTSKEFRFNRVFGDGTPQAEFSRTLVDEVVGVSRQNGKGCLILSYGVTNSGKTYTIFGSHGQPGILPTLISSVGIEVKLRALEIYNDVPYCLRSGREVNEMRALENCQPMVVNEGNMEEVISKLINLRRTNETDANQNSSRSHAIFTVDWQGYHVAIADLAGNEKFSENTNFTETVKINGNLLVLGQCLTAFRDGGFLPYRRSKLTTALMEYFKPPYKIYMVAHLNRSGQMFHENLNVLEYAAISTSINHLYPNYAKNPSIAKSLKKPIPNVTPTRTPRSPGKKAIVTEEDLDREQNRYLLEHYKCFIMGVNAQAEADLDEYFRREDEKDRLFIEELRATNYNGPNINHKKIIEEANAKSRIKLREIFREEAMREHKEKQVDCATVMGQSILKDYYDKLQREEEERKRECEEERRLMEEERVREEQLWREEKEHLRKEQQQRARFIEERLRAIEEERRRAQEEERQMRQKGVDFSTSIGSSFKKASIPVGLNEQSILTPLKLPTSADSGSFLRRMVSNPVSMIESGYRMITNLHQVANQMMSTFRGLVCDQRPMPNNPEGERMAAHVAHIICSKQVAVVGGPDAEGLVFVKEGMKASQEATSQQQCQEIIHVQEIEFRDDNPEAKAAEQLRINEMREREEIRQQDQRRQQEELRNEEERREQERIREREKIRQQERQMEHEEMRKKEEAEQQSQRKDMRQSGFVMGQALGSQSSAPFQSQESTIMARQELSQSYSLADDTNQANVQILQDFRESQKEQPILPNHTTSLIIPNHQQQPEQSMLLDGLRSEKDLSTNRTSEVDLLRSDSTCKNQLLPIESIPEVDNETSTKPVLGRSPKPIHEIPASLRPYLNKHSEPTHPVIPAQAKLNETGFKSTQQTHQAGSERTKIGRSISQHKKSNKHRHCNERSNSRPIVNPPSRKENYMKRNRSKDSHELSSREISSIKTRNQRKAKK